MLSRCGIFDQHRKPLSDPDTQGRHAALDAATLHLSCQRAHNPRPGAAQGMTERDAAAPGVDPRVVVGRGRDAVDVALMTSFGPLTLTEFEVRAS